MFLFQISSSLPDVSILVVSLLVLAFVLKHRPHYAFGYLIACAAYSAIAVAAAYMLKRNGFDFLRLLCIGVFPGGCALFAILWFYARSHFKILPKLFILYFVIIFATAVDAFLIEPRMLDTTHATIKSSKIDHSFRIAVLSDLQCDELSSYEKYVVQTMLSQKPDLILLPGDYVQDNAFVDLQDKQIQMQRMNKMFKDLNLSAPMGVYAVHGNCEDDSWTQIFRGLPVKCFNNSDTIKASGLAITGLTLQDSFNPHVIVPKTKEFHIVVAHGPDFVLAKPDADLLVCGHTHGGQVQIPFFGPPITLCHLPREWAQGTIEEIYPGTTLALSRGVGMEREFAPRLRFFCHPQILIIDVDKFQ